MNVWCRAPQGSALKSLLWIIYFVSIIFKVDMHMQMMLEECKKGYNTMIMDRICKDSCIILL